MIFLVNDKRYVAAAAAQIVLEMAREAKFELIDENSVRDFLRSEVANLADFVHPRELELDGHLTTEILAFNFLCLLDENSLGKLIITATNDQLDHEL